MLTISPTRRRKAAIPAGTSEMDVWKKCPKMIPRLKFNKTTTAGSFTVRIPCYFHFGTPYYLITKKSEFQKARTSPMSI